MKRWTLLGLLVIWMGATAFAQFEHPDLRSHKKQVRTLLLLPVEVQISKIGSSNREPLTEESQQAEGQLTKVVGAVLDEMGYKLDGESLSAETIEKDADLSYMVDDLQKKFDGELLKMSRHAKDVRQGRFSLGDDVSKLPAGDRVDALLFVRAAGRVLDNGTKEKALGVLLNGEYDSLQLWVGVVDAQSGDVLYLAKPFMFRNLATHPEATAAGLRKSFKNFAADSPAAAPTLAEAKP